MSRTSQPAAESLPSVPVHPTLGDLDDLIRAAAEHEAVSNAPQPTVAHAPADPFDDAVVGAPTLGSLTELRFAHHAHACECGCPSPSV